MKVDLEKINLFKASSAPSFNYAIRRLSQQISKDARVGVELVHELTEKSFSQWQFAKHMPANNLFIMKKSEQKQELQNILNILENQLHKVIESKKKRDHAIEIAEQNLEYALYLRPI